MFKLFDKSCFQEAHSVLLTFSLSLEFSRSSPGHRPVHKHQTIKTYLSYPILLSSQLFILQK